MEFETENWGQKLLCDEGRPVDGDIVKPGVGATVGCAMGDKLGSADGGVVVGSALGSALGSADGRAVVGSNVGIELGAAVLTNVGAAVGAYVTRLTPAPVIADVPEHVDEPMQPSRIRYVCGGVLAGTVYCTCAHTLPPAIQAAGGRLPEPVSSYTTSTPDAE